MSDFIFGGSKITADGDCSHEITQEETCIPRRNSRILPQLEKKHVGPPSALDEALAHYSVSREVPGSVLTQTELWHTGSSSLTKGLIWALCIVSAGSWALDHLGKFL